MTTFALQNRDKAYAAFLANGDARPPRIYVLARVQDAPGDSISLVDAWALQGSWALIVRDAPWDFSVEDPSSVATALGLASMPASTLFLAWRADPDAAQGQHIPAAPPYQVAIAVPSGDIPPAGRQVLASATLALANVKLTITVGAAVGLGQDGSSLLLSSTQSQFSIGRTDVTIGLLAFSEAILSTSATDGIAAGGLRGSGGPWPASNLFQLGQDSDAIFDEEIAAPEVRFWWGSAADQRLRLPLFAQVDIDGPQLAATFALNPALPFDPMSTRFDIAQTQGCFTSTSGLLTRDGKAVGLTPSSGVGFHFARGFAGNQQCVYLAPYGRFTLAAQGAAQAPFRLLPGLSGLEFVEVGGGDILELVPGFPAYGAIDAAGGAQSPDLDPTCTTSWVRLVLPTGVSRPYYAQPPASVFYASPDGTSLPRAADAKVSDLGGADKVWPLAPYANVFAPWLTSRPSAAAVTTFERVFLAGRRSAILGGQNQPVFSIDGVTISGNGATPRGLFAEIGPAATAAGRSNETATPAGQWRRLTLAKGTATSVTLEPSSAGVIDPLIGNALLQPDLLLVYTNWAGYQIGCSGQLDFGGFTFDWSQAHPPAMMVVKFSSSVSLKDAFKPHTPWRDAEIFVGDPAAVEAAKAAFAAALAVAKQAHDAGQPLFDDFLTRIVGSPAWTGIVAFGVSVDGNAMPPTLQLLLAGIDGTLKAHHVAVDVTSLSAEKGVPKEPGRSAMAGVISYESPGPATLGTAGDYSFYTKSIQVGFLSSVVTSFTAEVGITANKLFGRSVALRPQSGDPALPNTFCLAGMYQVIGTEPTVTFRLNEARTFDVVELPGVAGGAFSRVLDYIEVDAAGLVQQGEPEKVAAGTQHWAQVTLGGQLFFAVDPFGVGLDLFSYGTEGGAGLALKNLGLRMAFVLDDAGKRVSDPTLEIDYSRLSVADGGGALRKAGMVGGLPFKLKGLLANEKGLDVNKLGGKPVQILQIAGQQTGKPQFALQFDLVIGSLGDLSGVHAALTAEMRLAWGPLDTTPDADGATMTIQLPGASGGFGSLNVQGMLNLVFGDANLMRVDYTPSGGEARPVYAILFNNVALSVMGLKLPPKVVSDLILFSDPRNATGSNLAACLAVRQR